MQEFLLKRKMKVRIKNPIWGVPITFLYSYNPEQFEILGVTKSWDKSEITESLRTDPKHTHSPIINGKEKYARLLIQKI